MFTEHVILIDQAALLEYTRMMAHEIKRKFLLGNQDWGALASGSFVLTQDYLSTTIEFTVSARVKSDGAIPTIKSKKTGIHRSEFEYQIPVNDAQ